MMFSELLSDFTGILDDFKPGPQTRTLTVAKPYCAPARNIITGALEPYGVKIHSITERTQKTELAGFLRRMKVEMRTHENLQYGVAATMFLPMAIVAKVKVNEAQAAWAEYLMLRTGKLYVPGEYVNAKNAQWAAKHGGQMPPAWKNGKPWIEASCKDGVQQWKAVQKATRGSKK